jgi:hypothetical protein
VDEQVEMLGREREKLVHIPRIPEDGLQCNHI